MTLVDLATPRAKLQAAMAIFVALVLPGGSLLTGNDVFAWTMFSKSETYRLTVVGTTHEGTTRVFDPRGLAPYVNSSLAFFLPEPGRFRHDPVGLTFRTGLGTIAALACALAPLKSIEITLEERQNLDAQTKVTVARADCR